MFPFILPLLEAQGDFLSFLWESGRAPRGKSHIIVRDPHYWVPLGFLTLRLVHISLQQFVNYSSGFPIPSTGFCFESLRLPLFVCLSFQSWGEQFTLCPPLSHRSKKNCWLFNLFSFLLIFARIKWQLPSSFHVEPKTKVWLHFPVR